MSQKLVVDKLWLCLCPSFTPALLRRATTIATAARPITAYQPRRCLSDKSNAKSRLHWQKPGAKSKPRPWTNGAVADDPDSLASLSVDQLEGRLAHVATAEPSVSRVRAILRCLIVDHGVKPKLEYYRALMLAHASASEGSVVGLTHVLEEIEEAGISMDSSLLHAALKVLSVHPDYELRQKILAQCDALWYQISVDGLHDVIIGMIRERQYELALHRFDTMISNNIEPRPYLFDLFIYSLGNIHEYDAVLDLVRLKIGRGMEVSSRMWYYLIDVGSKRLHHSLTSYVWNRRVTGDHLNPPSGVCTNVLLTAARAGDVKLAQSVIVKLEKRSDKATLNDYEILVDAFLTKKDLDGALRVFSLMQKIWPELDRTSTRTLAEYIETERISPVDMWTNLRNWHDVKNFDTPIAIINVLLELLIRRDQFQHALKLYKEYPALTDDKANTETFITLLNGCQSVANTRHFEFIVREIRDTGIPASPRIYAKIVRFLLQTEQIETAQRYIDEIEHALPNGLASISEKSRRKWRAIIERQSLLAAPEAFWKIWQSLAGKDASMSKHLAGEQSLDGEKEAVPSEVPQSVPEVKEAGDTEQQKSAETTLGLVEGEDTKSRPKMTLKERKRMHKAAAAAAAAAASSTLPSQEASRLTK